MARVFHKSVQLVQGVIMLISITIILRFNFEKRNISYVSLFLRNFKISFLSVFTVYFVLFYREKNLTISLNKFCLHAFADLRRIARIAMARCTREAKFEVVQHHHIQIYPANFLLCYIKFIPL